MKRYKNLSYFRVLACIGIVCTHLRQRVGIVDGRLYELTHYMQHGVYMFFIIGGFLAVYTYEARSYKPHEYWMKRITRILPAYYMIVIYNVIVHQFIFKDMPADNYGLGWLRYIFCINQCVPGETQWRNLSFTWTIGVFVAFYMLVPLICRLMKSYRGALAGIVINYGFMLALEKVYSHYGIDREWFTPLFYIIYFTIGAGVYYAVKEKKENSLAVIFLAVILYNFSMSKYNSPITLALLFAVMILVTMEYEIHNEYIQKFFDVIDKYSYQIYLGHAVVMEIIDMMQANIAMPAFVTVVIAVAGTAVISVTMYYLENTLLLKKRHIHDKIQ